MIRDLKYRYHISDGLNDIPFKVINIHWKEWKNKDIEERISIGEYPETFIIAEIEQNKPHFAFGPFALLCGTR